MDDFFVGKLFSYDDEVVTKSLHPLLFAFASWADIEKFSTKLARLNRLLDNADISSFIEIDKLRREICALQSFPTTFAQVMRAFARMHQTARGLLAYDDRRPEHAFAATYTDTMAYLAVHEQVLSSILDGQASLIGRLFREIQLRSNDYWREVHLSGADDTPPP